MSLPKEMAIHSSIIAWKVPWTEEHGRLKSMGSQRVGHDWVTSLSFTFKKNTGNEIQKWLHLNLHIFYINNIVLICFKSLLHYQFG